MANHDAGETLQKAIAEGRARQCTAMVKGSTERCKRAARDGYDVCCVHGAGTAIREANGSRRPPGRPSEHGLYGESLNEGEKTLFDEAFGDLTLVSEAALAKVKLAQFVRKMADDLEDAARDSEVEESGPEDDPRLEVVGRNTSGARKNVKEKEYYFIRLLETVVKTTSAAYDQLRDKKILVTLQGDESELLERARELVSSEMESISGLVCSDCRRKIMEHLRERQQTVIDG